MPPLLPMQPFDTAKPIEGRVLYVEDNLANLTLMRHVFRMLPDIEFVVAPGRRNCFGDVGGCCPRFGAAGYQPSWHEWSRV